MVKQKTKKKDKKTETDQKPRRKRYFNRENDALSKKQERFVNALVNSDEFDYKKAAVEAGYHPLSGQRVAKLPAVRKRLKEVIEQRNRVVAISSSAILEELSHIALLDPIDLFFEKDGELHVKSLDDLTPLQRKLIDKIDVRTETRMVRGSKVVNTNVCVSSITSGVKLKALELLMKHKGMLIEKRQEEHVHTVNWADYYKARDDEMARREKAEKNHWKGAGYLEQAESDMRDNMYGTLYEGGPEPIDAEYSVKELLDSVDDDEAC